MRRRWGKKEDSKEVLIATQHRPQLNVTERVFVDIVGGQDRRRKYNNKGGEEEIIIDPCYF